MALFGPSKQEIAWREFAQEVEGVYLKGKMFSAMKVVSDLGFWTMVLDTYTVSDGKTSSTYTRFSVPFGDLNGFRFKVYNQGLFSKIGKAFGMQDIEIGDTTFDEKYIIKGNSEDKIKELLLEQRIKDLVLKLGSIYIDIRDKGSILDKKIQQGNAILYYYQGGVITDKERLKTITMLMAESLKKLYTMGVIDNKRLIDISALGNGDRPS